MARVYDNIDKLEIRESRWTTIFILYKDGKVVDKLIASADSADTYGDGIYFGTFAEYREDTDEFRNI